MRHDTKERLAKAHEFAISEIVGQFIVLRPHANGEKIGVCPFHKEKTGSFTVSDAKGFFHCFGCGAHGDVVDFIQSYKKIDFGPALDYLLGGEIMATPRDQRAIAEARHREEKLEKNKEDVAKRLWRASVPLSENAGPSQIVRNYLRARGVLSVVSAPVTLRAMAGLKHTESQQRFPGMVAAIQAIDGRIIGAHRTFLDPIRPVKADVTPKKKVLGNFAGGAIRLTPPARRMFFVEGIETGLTALDLLVEMGHSMIGVWSVVAGDNMPWRFDEISGQIGGCAVPSICTRAILLGDGDNTHQALYDEKMMARIVQCRKEGMERVVYERPKYGCDLNDLVGDPAAARRMIADAVARID